MTAEHFVHRPDLPAAESRTRIVCPQLGQSNSINVVIPVQRRRSHAPKKTECRHDSSRNPRQGALQNSTWPAPLSGRGPMAASVVQEPFGSGWRFLREAVWTLSRRPNCQTVSSSYFQFRTQNSFREPDRHAVVKIATIP